MSDKRSVATDALATLGTIIDEHQKRDAIHLAVEPVIAGEKLWPGAHIVVKDGIATAVTAGNGLGIVDPFLTVTVKKGDRFWFVMYPRQVTSLRHVWAHPAFPDEVGTPAPPPDDDRITKAKARIAEIASKLADSGSVQEGHEYGATVPMTYDRLMAAADRWFNSNGQWDDYTTEHGGDSWQDQFIEYVAEFWTLYQVVTGKHVPERKRESFFSCTC